MSDYILRGRGACHGRAQSTPSPHALGSAPRILAPKAAPAPYVKTPRFDLGGERRPTPTLGSDQSSGVIIA